MCEVLLAGSPQQGVEVDAQCAFAHLSHEPRAAFLLHGLVPLFLRQLVCCGNGVMPWGQVTLGDHTESSVS